MTLGRHGPLTPELARKRALQEKAAVAGGADPSGDRRKRRRENTLAEIADRYVAEHVASHNRASTTAEVLRIVENRIKPKLGTIKITDLKRPDNPCTGIQRFPERKRERFLSGEELARLGDALASYDGWRRRRGQAVGVHWCAPRLSPRAEMGVDRFRARRGAAARQ